MLKAILCGLAVCLVAAGVLWAEPPSGNDAKDEKGTNKATGEKMPALNFTMKDIDGNDVDLHKYYGNVILMVNTASKCGYTPQYEGLEKLYEKYRDQNFVVLAFPANNFGKQEPGSNSEIKEFCTQKFSVTFPIFGKVSVKGKDICPLYKYLTAKDAGHEHGGEVKWNFFKFVINRKGEVVERFDSRAAPDSGKLLKVVEKALKEPIPDDSPLAAAQGDKASPKMGG